MRKRIKKERFPEKTTINLVVREKTMNSPSRALPVFFVVLVLVALFGKYAVADRYAEIMVLQRDVDALTRAQAELSEELVDYDAVREEYRIYSSDWMLESETQMVDRLDVLALVDGLIKPKAQVDRLSMRGNVISANLSQVTLREAAGIVAQLYQNTMVSEVTVSTAGTQNQSAKTAVYMTIVLRTPQEQKWLAEVARQEAEAQQAAEGQQEVAE